MVYNYTSVEVPISQLIRRAKFTDATYADDILEWAREAMNELRYPVTLVPKGIDIIITNNLGVLPNNVTLIDGFFYNGRRLRRGNGPVDPRLTSTGQSQQAITSFFSDTNSPAYQNSQSYDLLRGADIKQLTTSAPTTNFYLLFPNHIQTSFKDGCVYMLYRSKPVDARGYPMIPDDESVRWYIFWYIAASLCMTGYKFPDSTMDLKYCSEQRDVAYIKSRRILRAWDTDKRESFLQHWVNLYPPQNYYNNFSISSEQPKGVKI